MLRVSFDIGLLSIVPILSWFVLSVIVDKNLINVFSLTYPVQCAWYVFRAVFATGANICKHRGGNKNVVMSGVAVGTVCAAIAYGILIWRVEDYIGYMGLEPGVYKDYAIYSLILLFLQLVFGFYLDKMYFEGKNNEANRHSIIFGCLNIVVLSASALLFDSSVLVISITLGVMAAYTVFIVVKESEKFKFNFPISKCFKYESSDIFANLLYFMIFLFGYRNAFEYGEVYVIAITFTSLIVDTQWDILDSISIVAKVDISRKKFNYKEHRRNAYRLLGLLILSSAIMFLVLYRFYELDFRVCAVFLGVEIVTFIIALFIQSKTVFYSWRALHLLPQ